MLGILKEVLWDCNINYTDIDLIITKNSFWKDVLGSWAKYNFIIPHDANTISQQVIWFNSHLRIANKPFFFKKAFQNGVIRIKDILNENGAFLAYDDFVANFGNSLNFIQYCSILHAIPQNWRILLQENDANIGME